MFLHFPFFMLYSKRVWIRPNKPKSRNFTFLKLSPIYNRVIYEAATDKYPSPEIEKLRCFFFNQLKIF